MHVSTVGLNDTMNGHGHSCGCCQTIVSGSTTQTLQELDFERGIWSAALNGDVERVEKFLTTRTDPNILDSAGYSALVRCSYIHR